MDESQKSQKKDEVLLDASQLSAPNNDLVNFNYESNNELEEEEEITFSTFFSLFFCP